MKKLLLSILLAICVSQSFDLQAQCLRVIRDTSFYDDGTSTSTTVRHYIYDQFDRIAKIESRTTSDFLFQYDTLYYMSGKLDSVVTFLANGTKTTVFKNTWSGNLLTKQTRREFFDEYRDTITYTYSGSALNTLTSYTRVSYDNGTLDDTETLTGITFTGNNLTGGSYMGAPSTITYDAYPNIFYGIPKEDDFLLFFSQNNATSAYANAAPGVPYFSRSYTYSNGAVESSSETYSNGESEVRKYVYDCATGIFNSKQPVQYSAYPNPSADGKFYLEIENPNLYEAVILNTTGEMISNVGFERTIKGLEIDLKDLNKGIYFLQLKSDKGTISSKLIRQ